MKDEYDFSQTKHGPIVPPSLDTTRITIHVDTDILNWFREEVNKSGGGSYQALINQVLRQHVDKQLGN